MTPAINEVIKHKLNYQTHKYSHDPAVKSYGLEAADKLGLEAERVYKTLVLALETAELVVAVLPVSSSLSMKKAASFFGVKKAKMAAPDHVQRATGYVLGGVSPLGQKKYHRTVVDASAVNFDAIYVSAGKRGVEIELKPEDLVRLLRAALADIAV